MEIIFGCGIHSTMVFNTTSAKRSLNHKKTMLLTYKSLPWSFPGEGRNWKLTSPVNLSKLVHKPSQQPNDESDI